MKIKLIPYIQILLFSVFLQSTYTQNSSTVLLQIISLDSIEQRFILKASPQKIFNSLKEATTEINRIVSALKKEGFYSIVSDSNVVEKNKYKAYFNLGEKLTSAVIKIPSNFDLELTDYRYQINNETIEIEIEKLENLLEYLSSLAAKKGNAFSKIKLKNTHIVKKTLFADLLFKKSLKRHIDSIIVKGYENFPKNYLAHFYKTNKKNVFNKKGLARLSKQTGFLKFATEVKAPEVLFSKDSTLIYLYLKKKKGSNFDGLVNFSTKEDGNGVSLKGYLDLNLINIFNTGEGITIHWKNTGKNRQFFKIKTTLPYLFNSKIITGTSFSIYKHDSTFVNISSAIKLSLPLNSKTSISLGYNQEDSQNLLNTTTSAGFSEFTSHFISSQIDYYSFHKNQFKISLQTSFGNRKTPLESLPQYKMIFNTSIILGLSKKVHLFVKNSSGYLNSKTLLQNELFRIGGPNSIRGFDQQSIFTSAYSFINSEFRYKTQKKTTIYSIIDFGIINNQISNQKLYSFGIGYAFKTDFNLLNISYVTNTSSETPFSLENAKITVKILTFF